MCEHCKRQRMENAAMSEVVGRLHNLITNFYPELWSSQRLSLASYLHEIIREHAECARVDKLEDPIVEDATKGPP